MHGHIDEVDKIAFLYCSRNAVFQGGAGTAKVQFNFICWKRFLRKFGLQKTYKTTTCKMIPTAYARNLLRQRIEI